MEDDIDSLVKHFDDLFCSGQVLGKIIQIFEKQSAESLSSFESIRLIEHEIWQRLGNGFYLGTADEEHLKLVHTVAAFNMKLVHESTIEVETKAHLLIPENIDWIDQVFDQLKVISEDNDPFWTIIEHWFDPLSHLVYDHIHLVEMPAIIQTNVHIEQDFIMTEQFKHYLSHLEQPIVSQEIFTAKQSFYMRTCLLSLKVYVHSKQQHFPYNGEQILEHIGDQYSRIIGIQSQTVESWSAELLTCIAHLNDAVVACSWWDTMITSHIKLLIPTDDVQHVFVQSLMCIVGHTPFLKQITSEWDGGPHMLIESTLLLLLSSLDVDNLSCYIRFHTDLAKILFSIAENCSHERIYLCAYGVLVRILSDDELKAMKLPDHMCNLFLDTLEQAWNHPWQRNKQIPVVNLLTRFLPIACNDCIQHQIAQSGRLSLLLDVCDQCPITFDILWALSFNGEIQDQLRTNEKFMAELLELERNDADEKIRKTIHGILWNLGSHPKEHETTGEEIESVFDIMISYAHSQKDTCKELYQQLISKGYRVWIDFDQMHGSIMDAMAQAIERSKTIIICMSEHYRKSSYCRAEACYAFQRQRRIVPVLLQQHYKPDGWLSFLIGQLLYVDFVKYEFAQALGMLIKELDTLSGYSLHDEALKSSYVNLPVKPNRSTSLKLSNHVSDWSPEQVSEWLTSNNLVQMANLLYDYDGKSLLYLHEYLANSNPQEVLASLQEDSMRRIKSNLSFIELARFRSLLDEHQRRAIRSKHHHRGLVASASKLKCHLM